jgi:hypothetical protein
MSRNTTSTVRRWSGLDDGVLAYSQAALRSLWVWPIVYLVSRTLFSGESVLLAPLTVFALLAGGTLAAQSAGLFVEGRRAALIVAVAGLAAVAFVLYLSIGRESAPFWDVRWLGVVMTNPGRALLTLAPAVWLWWWGLTAGRDRVQHDDLVRDFAVGLVALLVVVAISASTQIMAPNMTLTILLAYLALGLFVLALATIQETRRYEGARAGDDLSLARHWWVTVGAIIATLLVVALLLSQFFMPETLGYLAAGVRTVLALLGQVVYWLILIVTYPIFMVLEWLAGLLPVQPEEGEPLPQLSALPNFADQIAELTEKGTASAPISQTPFWIVGGVLAVVVIIVIFVLAFRHFRRSSEDDVAESHESILSLDLLKAQLAQLLRRKGASNCSEPEPFATLNGDDPRMRIRHIYQALLVWSTEQGVVRPPGMTPSRYQTLLSSAFPDHDEQFEAITAAYDLARYGAAPVAEESAIAVAAAWQEILAHSAAREG